MESFLRAVTANDRDLGWLVNIITVVLLLTAIPLLTTVLLTIPCPHCPIVLLIAVVALVFVIVKNVVVSR